MRRIQHVTIAGLLFATLSFPPFLTAQRGSNVKLVPYLISGSRTAPIAEINTVLSNNGFGEEALSNEPFGDKLAIGGGVDITTNRWTIGIEATTDLPKSERKREPDISFNSIGLQLNNGYQLLPAGKMELYPLLGLGARFGSLNVNGREADNTEFHGSARLGTGYAVFESPTARLSVGLRGEYAFGFTDSWSESPVEADEGPDMKLHGFSFFLGAGIGF